MVKVCHTYGLECRAFIPSAFALR